MAIVIQDLSTLDQAQVDQFDAELTTLIQEFNPDLDLRSGVLHDLLLHFKAILDTADQTNIDRWRQSSSLLQITADPTLADTDIVDNLLSNYNLTRNPGSKASGEITIVLTQLLAVVIPVGSVFTVNGIDFATTTTFAARTSVASVVGPTDILIVQIGVGQYAFDIPVTALALGTAGNVARATVVIPAAPPPKFLKAFVTADFSGGTDLETNEQLLAKLAGGEAVTAWANRPSIEGLLRKQAAFANIKAVSIVGFGDAEMLRDQHAVWPGSTGGRVDLYLRSQDLYENATLVKTATLVAKVGPLGTWQVGIGLDEAPGFYLVDKVLLPSQDQTGLGFVPTSDVRSLDLLSPVLPPPDLADTTEGVYSRYQAAVIQFEDTVTDATALTVGVATQDYNVVTRVLPLIAEAQDFLNQRSQRPPMGDVLVKAPLPCFTFVSFIVNYDAATDTPSESAIQNAIASAVNNMGFTGKLASSLISQVLHDLLPNLISVTGVDLIGAIRQPDGFEVLLNDPEEIFVVDDPPNMVTGRTVAFYLRPEDVAVVLVAVDIPDV